MKKALLAAVLLLPCAALAADWSPTLPEGTRLTLEKPVDGRPAEARFPALELLNRFRRTGLVVELGGRRYHASLQLNRTETWHLVLLPENGNVHDPAAVLPARAFAENRAEKVDGRLYALALRGEPGDETLVLKPKGCTTETTIVFSELEKAVYDAASPVDALGPGWKVLFQSEVWEAADARSFVFLEKEGTFVLFHVVPAAGVDWTREVVREAGRRKVGLSFDDQNRVVIRPVGDPASPSAND
ncbi:MAG: hypothetical protein WC969_03165 [Elusimicrobiota bacterium]|jgi:hypothetical protein